MPEANTDQAQGQSVEDRVASLFESEQAQEAPQVEAEAETEESEQPVEDEAEVEYEGQRYRVPKALEKAILQEADYTRKTQEIANQRKLLEQSQSNVQLVMMENEFHQSVAEDVHNLKTLDKHIEAMENVDYNGMDSDQIVRHLADIQRGKSYREKLSSKIEKAHAEFKQQFGKQLTEAKAKSHDYLSKAVPGYTPESFKEARDYGSKLGFAEQVLDSIEADPKAASVLYKAMRFDALQANKATAVKRLDAPVIKPGATKPMPQEVKDKLNYKKALKSAQTRDERNAIIQRRVEGMF